MAEKSKESELPMPQRTSAITHLYRGILLEVPLISLIEAYDSPMSLASLFSERLIEGKKSWIRRSGRETGTSWSGSRSIAEMFAWDAAGPDQSPRGVGNFSGKIYVSRLYTGSSSPPGIHIPVVLSGRPEVSRTNTDSAWQYANSRDKDWWGELEDEYRLEEGAPIKLEHSFAALPPKDRLIWALNEFNKSGSYFSVAEMRDGKTQWVTLNTPLRLTAASWRGLVSHDMWNDAPAVILVDKLGRRNSYEVYVNGRQVSREWLLDDAKRKAEGELEYAIKWRRSKTAEIKALHYYFGWTTEFTDPSLVYFGEPA